jgi:CRISPR-associated protein Cas5h
VVQANNLVVFEARGAVAHFRRPDTLGTHASYPFITRTALRGLIASILGRESLPETTRCGVRLLSPVRTVTHELSLHGKTWEAGSGAEASFSRPTSIAVVAKPAYRLYSPRDFADALAERLAGSRSHYHTYLGAAYCLTFPRLVARLDRSHLETVEWRSAECLETATVVPARCVRRLEVTDGQQYARVGGVLYQHIGGRRFRGTINLLYEVHGKPISFQPQADADVAAAFVRTAEEGVVCLW